MCIATSSVTIKPIVFKFNYLPDSAELALPRVHTSNSPTAVDGAVSSYVHLPHEAEFGGTTSPLLAMHGITVIFITFRVVNNHGQQQARPD